MHTTSRSGQAMIEFIAGLVIVVMLVAGLLQFIAIADAHTRTMSEARAIAGDAALSSTPLLDTPDYLTDWEEGPDEMRHTADDVPTQGLLTDVQRDILDRSAADTGDWALLDSCVNNDISELRSGILPMAIFGFVQGESSDSVPLWSATRNLVYNDESVDVRTEVWMPKAGGFY